MTMLKVMLACVIAALGAGLVGQDAKIRVIGKADTVRLQKAYGEYQAAKKAWEAVKEEVGNKYAADWGEIEFSPDFGAFAPVVKPIQSVWPQTGWWIPAGGGYTYATTNTLTGGDELVYRPRGGK